MTLKYKEGDVVVLGEKVDVNYLKTFVPGAVVKITQLCCLGHQEGEHYTVELVNGSRWGQWWIRDDEINHEATEALQKFKPGDRVRVNHGAGFNRGAVGTVIVDKRNNPKLVPMPEGAVSVKRDGAGEDDCVFFFKSELELVEEKSNETTTFSTILTSISVVNNKAKALGTQQENVVSDTVFNALYFPDGTHISLDAGKEGVYIVIQQQGNAVVHLDIDEVDAVFSAIKKLTSQLGEWGD